MKFTKFFTTAVAASVLVAAAPAFAEDVKLGFIGGFTGPIESLTPPDRGYRQAEAGERSCRYGDESH